MNEKVNKIFGNEGVLYRNTGKKIMIFSKIYGWILLVAGIIVCICFITNKGYYSSYLGQYMPDWYDESDDWIGWVSLAAGFLSFVSSWFIYGYGQIIDDIRTLKNHAIDNSSINNEELPEL